ncbi:MAG: DnaJ domain-containing protein [Labilithrix sp.]|nr:DnaJ domain-containing protein [Labilithrix sp.]MCW5831226.1 DnaJ domain-containing protein [Labilithrix sp.]
MTGTFELSLGAAPIATMLVIGGCPAKIRTAEPIHYLGTVLSELGMITPDQLAASLARMQEGPRLQGQVLLEMGAIDPARLDAGLRSQVELKVEHLFGLSGDTTFAYYDNLDLLQSVGGPPTPIDPFPVLWRGVREKPAWEHVDATLRRIGGAHLRVSANAQLQRFAFNPQEQQAVELLRQRSARVVDVSSVIGPGLGQILVYFLLIMKQVELSDGPAAAPQPASVNVAAARQAPANPPPSSSGQAFARVQLQRQASRSPLVVEEHVAASGANDERASSPGMRAPTNAFGAQPSPIGASPSAPPEPVISAPPEPMGGAQAAGLPMDIGSMITQTIQQSAIPPAMPSGSAPSVPAPESVPQIVAASEPPASSGPISVAPPSSSRQLTAEQNALKTKILERAEQINAQDYFQMLGLERDAAPEAVQKAFIGLAKVWHPDRLPPALVDVKDACSKVFTHLTEAHATLMDPAKRHDYMTLLKDGGATPEDQAKIQAVLEAATEFQKAEFLLKRNMGDPQAYEIVKRCVALDGEQADYLATLAWLDAQKPEWLSREKTLEKALLLDRCIQKNPNCERAFFYRGMLYKRAEEPNKALKDFKKAAELNPRNLDAMREVRLHNMRGGASKPPPGLSGGSTKPAPQETIGGLFGKLFKK